MKVALYIRVSTEEQKLHGLSIETQKEALTAYAEKHNMQIVGEYIDAGLTARKKLAHRKELLRLLDDVKSGEIDQIIFTKLDRWFRNIADYYKVQEILDDNNVNWKTIFESYDTSTSNGRLHINIMLSIAQDEADRTSERIKAVFENKRARGETTVWRAPIGYKVVDSKLIVDSETKQIAIDIFEYYDLHHSISGCVRMAREKYGYNIYDYSIRRMFENQTYIGAFRGINGFNEAIISEELFQRIKSYRKVRVYKNQLVNGRVYLFSSLLICSECNHNMTSCFTIQKQKSGIVEYHYYRCKEASTQHTCTHNKRVNEEKLEKYLLNNIKLLIKKKKLEIEKKGKAKKTIYQNADKLSKRLSKLKDLYLDDLISKDDYKLEYNSIMKQLSEINKSKITTDSSKYDTILCLDLVSVYNDFSQEEKKTFWLGIIEKILVDSDNKFHVYLR